MSEPTKPFQVWHEPEVVEVVRLLRALDDEAGEATGAEDWDDSGPFGYGGGYWGPEDTGERNALDAQDALELVDLRRRRRP